ncbi:MAG: hypothetical protein ACYCXB_07055 [Candidatus Humimicrobiaceae bacterium]
MLKKYLNKSKLLFVQENFIKTLEGIGDILIFYVKQGNKNKIVLQGLKKIDDIIKKLFDLRKNNPDKFEKLILAQDFFDIYDKNKEEASLRISFYPEKYLIVFSTAINQFLRIHERAIEEKNDEISRFASYHLSWILEYIANEKSNNIFVEQILKKIHQVNLVAIKNLDISMYSSSVHWYKDIVFNKLGDEDNKFDLSYLELFDNYFFRSIQNIVSGNIENLFKNLVSTFVDGLNIDINGDKSVWDYGHIILEEDLKKYNEIEEKHNIENKIKELDFSYNYLYSRKEYDEWIAKFEEFKSILIKYFNEDQEEKSKKVEREIRNSAETKFKFNNLLEIIFAAGAYCLFENRPEFITYLWEYKQPPDSDSVWVGHDIVPENIGQLICLYFRKELFARRFDFWVDHRGNELYLKKYFILLLMLLLERIKENEQGEYEQIINFELPNLNIYSLSNIEYSVDEFIKIAKTMEKDLDLFKKLRFDANNIDNLFSRKLFPFFKILKNRAQDSIKELNKVNKISAKKIDEFKSEFLKEFYKKSMFRSIFNYYNIYENKVIDEYKGKLKKYGINQVIDKATFFNEWHVSYSGIGSNYGRNLARGDDFSIYTNIYKKCKSLGNIEFEEALKLFQNPINLIVILVNINSDIYFSNSKMFKPKWYKDCPKYNIRNFNGVYTYEKISMPIFNFYRQGEGKKIMILDMSNFGSFMQYSPIDNVAEKKSLFDIFYFSIETFSDNQIILDKMLNNPPKWLEKVGSRSNQEDYLKSQTLINIFERYDFSFKDKFQGFYYELREDSITD